MEFKITKTKLSYTDMPIDISFNGGYKLSIKDVGFTTSLMINIAGDLSYTCESADLPDAQLNIDADYVVTKQDWEISGVASKNYSKNMFYQDLLNRNLLSEDNQLAFVKTQLIKMVSEHIIKGRFKEMQAEVEAKLGIANPINISF